MASKQDRRRDSIERALIHHGIDYSPPGPSRSTWRMNTSTGTKYYSGPEAVAYCQGLADHEALPTCRGSAPEGLSGTNDALTSASAPQGTTEGDPGASAEGSRGLFLDRSRS